MLKACAHAIYDHWNASGIAIVKSFHTFAASQ